MKREHILIVEDEDDIAELIRYNLASEGYEVTRAVSGEEALNWLRTNYADLMVLDLMLPGMDGLMVARILKSEKSDSQLRRIPVIMLTAKAGEEDIVKGLEFGADDYITKPFSPKVLSARIKAVLRRRESKEQYNLLVLRVGNLTIDPGRRVVCREETSIDLTFTEFQILHLLAGRPGWVFSRSQIVDAVRGVHYPVTERSVDVQIAGLRKKLGESGKYIETVRGVGYRFRES